MRDADYRKFNDRTQNSSTNHKKDCVDIRAKLKQQAKKEIESHFKD